MLGKIALLPEKRNRIGLIIDKCDRKQIDLVLCAVDAVRAVHGIDTIGYVVTDKKIGGTSKKSPSGNYGGFIENPEVLIRAADKLVNKGATALAITSEIRGVQMPKLLIIIKEKHLTLMATLNL